jgi:hypothetical protein
MLYDDFAALLGETCVPNNLSVALDLAERGFAVFPIRDWGDGDGWKPIKRFQKKASADLAEVRDWWMAWPDALVGLLAGERNGVTVLDIDVKNGKDGTAALASLGFCDLTGMSPVRVRTPSGGWHLFFRYDARLRNSVSKIGAGIDVKTEGGYVIAPGSLKGSMCYSVEGAPLGSIDLPEFPECLIPTPDNHDSVEPIAQAADDQRDWAAAKLRDMAERLATQAEGGRNSALNEAAMWAGGAAAHGFLTEEDARAELLAAAEKAGLRERETRSTFRSGFMAGLRRPISDFPVAVDASAFDDLEDLAALSGEDHKPKAAQLRFLTPSECAAAPSRGYVVKGLLAPADVACVFGAPGAGKSLISPHIGYAVAKGSLAFGMRTRAGKVFYVPAEDPHGMRGRVAALKLRHGDAPNFTIVEGVSDLLAKESPDLKALHAAVVEHRPALVFIDTLAMAFPGLEENSADEMGRVVAIARKLASHGSAVVLIHHDTKAQGPTPRGHSLLNGALDVALQLFPRDEEGIVRGRLTKNRNGSSDRDIAFRITTESMGLDEDGDTITYAVVNEVTPGSVPKRIKLSISERAALDQLHELHNGNGQVSESDWRKACISSHAVSASEDRDNRKRAFNRALSGLVRKEMIQVAAGFVRLPASNLEGNAFDEKSLEHSGT